MFEKEVSSVIGASDSTASEIAVRAELFQAVAACGQILGTAFLAMPDPATDDALGMLLCEGDLADEWPFGSEAELAAAQELLMRGLAGEVLDHKRAYQRLFRGPNHLEAPPWGSVYLDKDNVVFGLSELRLRQWMREKGITRTPPSGDREPADHIGLMLALMAWLAEHDAKLLSPYLAEHMLTWSGRYLELLTQHAAHPYYEGLALLCATTLKEIASELFLERINAPLYY